MKEITGGRKTKLIIQALQNKLGIENPIVWYEPINGPCFEMIGYKGGWYYKEDEEDCQHPLGYNTKEALELINLISNRTNAN